MITSLREHTAQADEALTDLGALRLLCVCEVVAQMAYRLGQGEGHVSAQRVAVDGRDQQREELLGMRGRPRQQEPVCGGGGGSGVLIEVGHMTRAVLDVSRYTVVWIGRSIISLCAKNREPLQLSNQIARHG
jgi:hypothetical protein